MPIHYGVEPANSFTGEKSYRYIQWGHHGHKYSYDPNISGSEEEAYRKAALQARAAHAHGYKG